MKKFFLLLLLLTGPLAFVVKADNIAANGYMPRDFAFVFCQKHIVQKDDSVKFNLTAGEAEKMGVSSVDYNEVVKSINRANTRTGASTGESVSLLYIVQSDLFDMAAESYVKGSGNYLVTEVATYLLGKHKMKQDGRYVLDITEDEAKEIGIPPGAYRGFAQMLDRMN